MIPKKVKRTKKKDSEESMMQEFSLEYDDTECNIGVPYNCIFGNMFEAYNREVPVAESLVASLSNEAIDYMVHLS